MGFSAEQTKFEVKKMIGTDLFHVTALNPTVEEMRIIRNVKPDKEVKAWEYSETTPEGIKKIQLVFWVKGTKTGIKNLRFNLYDQLAETKSGKKVWIDERGNDCFAETKEQITSMYFDKSTARQGYRGELELTRFLRTLLDRKNDEIKSCRLDDVKKIIDGDLSEIKYFVKNFAKQICLLVYGDEKGYTNVWQGGLGRPYTLGDEKYWQKRLDDCTDGMKPKAVDGGFSIALKEWAGIKMDDDKPEVKKSEFPHHSTIKSDLDATFDKPKTLKSPF